MLPLGAAVGGCGWDCGCGCGRGRERCCGLCCDRAAGGLRVALVADFISWMGKGGGARITLPVVLVINTWLARDREEGRRGKEEGSSGAQSALSAVAVVPRRGRRGAVSGNPDCGPWLRLGGWEGKRGQWLGGLGTGFSGEKCFSAEVRCVTTVGSPGGKRGKVVGSGGLQWGVVLWEVCQWFSQVNLPIVHVGVLGLGLGKKCWFW